MVREEFKEREQQIMHDLVLRTAELEQARTAFIKQVLSAFNEGLTAWSIGQSIGMTEAGARMIRKRHERRRARRV